MLALWVGMGLLGFAHTLSHGCDHSCFLCLTVSTALTNVDAPPVRVAPPLPAPTLPEAVPAEPAPPAENHFYYAPTRGPPAAC
ncbi:MAG: hypothetical protein ACLFTT_07395 [Candidatus Hydrogenedentota bacterium]